MEIDDGVLRVAELFAGVGGFRLGLESVVRPDGQVGQAFEVVWSNQFEPSTRRQHASKVYSARFGHNGHTNEDIFQVIHDESAFNSLRATNPEVLVAGFPCQDYSVARTLAQADGLEGRKGVLWWAIHALLRKRFADGAPVKYLVLENVDRLLKSPAKRRGRDFGVILSSLQSLGYAVEWSVVNAAEFGFPQRRRRVFMVAYHQSTALWSEVIADTPEQWVTKTGVMARAFPRVPKDKLQPVTLQLAADVVETQDLFDRALVPDDPFRSAGVMAGGHVWSIDCIAAPTQDYRAFTGATDAVTLGQVVAKTAKVPGEYFLSDDALSRWRYYKGAKTIERRSKSGHVFNYSEGALPFPDPLDRPARTIITGEGGSAASRTKHVVEHRDGRLRRLVPEELEELMGFPRGHTALAGIPDARRAFLMGNAVVVGVVRRIGESLVAAVQAASQSKAPATTSQSSQALTPEFAA